MADSKLSALTALAGSGVDTAADKLYIDDVSVTTSKSILVDELGIALNATQAEVDAGTDTKGLISPSLKKVSLLATQATTSGTEKDFTVVAGATKIALSLNGVSTNGTSNLYVQLGDSGGIENSGYVCIASNRSIDVPSTTGFTITVSQDATNLNHGVVYLELVDAATFTWTLSSKVSAGTTVTSAVGYKALTAELTTVRLTTTNGSDAFDAGLAGCNYIR